MKYLTECSDLGQGQYDHFGLVVLVPVVCVCVFLVGGGGNLGGGWGSKRDGGQGAWNVHRYPIYTCKICVLKEVYLGKARLSSLDCLQTWIIDVASTTCAQPMGTGLSFLDLLEPIGTLSQLSALFNTVVCDECCISCVCLLENSCWGWARART